jgi:hypothetical protein
MPIRPMSKRAIYEDWSKWSEYRQTEKEIDEFEKDYPLEKGFNIAIVLGDATDTCVVDDDTDIPEVSKMLPRSPVCSSGQKGLAGFFRSFKGATKRNLKLWTFNKWGKKNGVDFLANGSYIMVYPSVHPDTKERYRFPTGQDNPENIPPSELPEIGPWIYETLDAIEARFSNKKQGSMSGGRNDNLVQIVSAMRFRGESEAKITEEIYNYDKNNHKPRLFTDEEEGYKAPTEADAFHNAFLFQLNVTRSLANPRKKTFKFRVQSEDLKILDTSKPLFEPRKLPEPSGVMKYVYDEILRSAYIPHENYALCGSLMLVATLACGRFHYMGNHPVLYSMIIAGTGWGKEAPVKVLKRILTHERMRNYKLMGYGSYTSSQTIAIRLPKQRSVLDIFDEMGTFFRGQGQSKDQYHREITDELLKLFSNQGSFYYGKVSMKRQETGDCFSPFVNLMGFIQPELFEESVGQISVSQGFLPRFLIFNTEKHSNYNREANDYVLNVDHIVGMLTAKFHQENIFGISNAELAGMDKDALRNLKPKPMAVMASNEFKEGIKVLGEEYAKKAINENNPMLAPFHTRVNELVKRVSLVHAISDARDTENICLNQGDLDWAKNLVEALQYNMTEKLKNIAPMTNDVKKTYKMLEKIKEIFHKTKQPVNPRDVYRSMNIGKREYETYRDNLIAFGKICHNMTHDRWNDTLTPLED